MSYPFFLALHSANRWLITCCFIMLLWRTYWGWKNAFKLTRLDHGLQIIAITLLYVQMTIGVSLYIDSPIVHYFIKNFSTAIKLRQVRFFGMEHITMMTIGVLVFTVGLVKAHKKQSSVDKFKTLFIYTAWTILILFTSIPWEFSPLTSRPSFRMF